MQDHLIQKEYLLFVLNRSLLVLAFLLFFGASYISNYKTTVNEAWERWNFLMYFNFILIFFSLRNEAKKLITKSGYTIVLYLLINYFFDRYLGLEGWSWNDFFTIVLIIFEILIHKIKKTYGKN
jgi:hypothetical protein